VALAGARPGASVATVPLAVETAAFRQALRQADILINATDAGRYPHHQAPSLVPAELLHPRLLVCDIVYTPRRTALLAAAEAAGCRTLPGLGMLAWQGAIAFEIWTGCQAPVDVMLAALEKALAERERASAGPGHSQH
jgi:shikimate dehydrogenase